ncbi:MAG: hypothetical protein HND44_24055 [Chloroflexi bacterium]|nr:hypothetical protein [Ardenticatenaceae bacterium]MBL1131502.1 hypothetical protein [Chloroflexota bacterium]NOG37613.1 hypothetical protein [Chloroflexota bacterium]GIK55591.1 MAG: hypothetical protein BroJett015_12540 [Chloroflexota bacterium]
MLKLLLITIGIWLATIVFILFAIGVTATLTADASAAGMDIPVLCLGTVAVFTVAADTFLLARTAQRVEDDGLRRLWISAFLVLELGTVLFLMLMALVVLNR